MTEAEVSFSTPGVISIRTKSYFAAALVRSPHDPPSMIAVSLLAYELSATVKLRVPRAHNFYQTAENSEPLIVPPFV